MRIALISVAPPYRGGISKHTSILVDKLAKKHSIDVINFKRQYPKFLFPGKTQSMDDLTMTLGDQYIDSINPVTWLRTGKILADRKYDLVIFRFWSPFFSLALGVIAMKLKQRSINTKMISLCDNIKPHENLLLMESLTRFFFKKMEFNYS